MSSPRPSSSSFDLDQAPPHAHTLTHQFLTTRRRTELLTAPLSAEDQQLQSMPSASPTKWHRAHTSWFFEEFILAPQGVARFHADFATLYNSYYVAVGPRHPRHERGLLSRPSVDEITRYRQHIDAQVVALLERATPELLTQLKPLIELGCAHEEQHQELILTDILHALSFNPLNPVCFEPPSPPSRPQATLSPRWQRHEGGLIWIGASDQGFTFDNERPRHRFYLEPFAIRDQLISVAEVIAFIKADGYTTPSLWLSEGFTWASQLERHAPLYSYLDGDALVGFTLHGERELEPDAPARHLSYYEADAIARFLDARLPTEHEWEHAARDQPLSLEVAHLLDADSGVLRSALDPQTADHASIFGGVWQWVASSYEPYPGFEAAPGALGEYNGKFMINQRVLRGGSCLTPAPHMRLTYRNFWHPDTRFQMTGARIARGEAP